jgi:hypothetical protein
MCKQANIGAISTWETKSVIVLNTIAVHFTPKIPFFHKREAVPLVQ